MRVLLVHNHYGAAAPSGENNAVLAERDLLTSRGHDVETFFRFSDDIRTRGFLGTLLGAFSTPWNPRAAAALLRQVDACSPDIVHVHNTFPLISPSIFPALVRRVPTVLTLHNYRLFCPAAIPMRNGHPCTDCLDRRSVWPALRHGCYRGSRLATLPLALGVALHRGLGTWTRQVDGFVALSQFQADVMIRTGLPPGKVHVKPNYFPGNPVTVPWAGRTDTVVFAGRLTSEKGVRTLVCAWRQWGPGAPELRILGDGPLRSELQKLAEGSRIRFLGQVAAGEARQEISRARLLVLPSECFEGFPMVVAEALAMGTPVAASGIGPLPFIVRHGESGISFPAGDPGALQRAVRAAWEHPGELERLGTGARRAFEQSYTEDANARMLLDIYGRVIEDRRRPRRAPPPSRERILDFHVETRGTLACVGEMADWVASGRGLRWLACLNPHSCAVSFRDPEFGRALRGADWVVPDGVGILLASRILGGSIRERVTGSDIFLHLSRRLNRVGGKSVFFLGATESTLEEIRRRMAREFPNLRVAGTYSPGFTPEFTDAEVRAMVHAVNAARPDVLWVGMTAPKQEKWIFRHGSRLNVKVACAIGAVFDFYTEKVPRSHPAFQRFGLEWLPRLLRQPGRLWRRTFVSAPAFLWRVVRSRVAGPTGHRS